MIRPKLKNRHKLPRWRKVPKNAARLYGRPIHLRALARKYHIDPADLSRVISGKKSTESMSVKKARVFAAAFGCTIDDLTEFILNAARILPSLTEVDAHDSNTLPPIEGTT